MTRDLDGRTHSELHTGDEAPVGDERAICRYRSGVGRVRSRRWIGTTRTTRTTLTTNRGQWRAMGGDEGAMGGDAC